MYFYWSLLSLFPRVRVSANFHLIYLYERRLEYPRQFKFNSSSNLGSSREYIHLTLEWKFGRHTLCIKLCYSHLWLHYFPQISPKSHIRNINTIALQLGLMSSNYKTSLTMRPETSFKDKWLNSRFDVSWHFSHKWNYAYRIGVNFIVFRS